MMIEKDLQRQSLQGAQAGLHKQKDPASKAHAASPAIPSNHKRKEISML